MIDWKLGDATTENGDHVRILMLDGGGDWPIIGAVQNGDSESWHTARWRADGMSVTLDRRLHLVPPKRGGTMWVNFYDDGRTTHHSRERADEFASINGHRLACIEVNWTEGDGLDH